MELYIAVVGIGICIFLNVIGLLLIDRKLSIHSEVFISGIVKMMNTVSDQITIQHKKTRKETQEIKTRLTQVRKDLNTLEKRKPIDKRLAKVK